VVSGPASAPDCNPLINSTAYQYKRPALCSTLGWLVLSLTVAALGTSLLICLPVCLDLAVICFLRVTAFVCPARSACLFVFFGLSALSTVETSGPANSLQLQTVNKNTMKSVVCSASWVHTENILKTLHFDSVDSATVRQINQLHQINTHVV